MRRAGTGIRNTYRIPSFTGEEFTGRVPWAGHGLPDECIVRRQLVEPGFSVTRDAKSPPTFQ